MTELPTKLCIAKDIAAAIWMVRFTGVSSVFAFCGSIFFFWLVQKSKIICLSIFIRPFSPIHIWCCFDSQSVFYFCGKFKERNGMSELVMTHLRHDSIKLCYILSIFYRTNDGYEAFHAIYIYRKCHSIRHNMKKMTKKKPHHSHSTIGYNGNGVKKCCRLAFNMQSQFLYATLASIYTAHENCSVAWWACLLRSHLKVAVIFPKRQLRNCSGKSNVI